eukprot:12915120-Prorocentrum_lima.AAC.1
MAVGQAHVVKGHLLRPREGLGPAHPTARGMLTSAEPNLTILPRKQATPPHQGGQQRAPSPEGELLQ